MNIIFGTRNEILIINADYNLMTFRTFESKWFSSETTETTMTLPISSLINVSLIEPKPFIKGLVTFDFDADDLITRRMTLRVNYRNRVRIQRLVRDLQNQINFT